MNYTKWPKRDPVRNCFLIPNEVYYLGLYYGAIAVYGYLLHIEDRKTYQSHAGCRTIGKATMMSANTVRKYVQELKERSLVTTEQTSITTRDGRKRNGVLRYHIRPIQEAVERHNERQMQRLEESVEKQKAQDELSRRCTTQVPLSGAEQHPRPHPPRETQHRAFVWGI